MLPVHNVQNDTGEPSNLGVDLKDASTMKSDRAGDNLSLHDDHNDTGERSNLRVNFKEVNFKDASTIISESAGDEIPDTMTRVTAETINSVQTVSDSSIRSRRSYIRPYYRSRLIAKAGIEKPWTKERKSLWPTVIPCFGFACGLVLIAVMVYLGVSSVPRHEYCLVMEDDFDGPTLNTSIWQHEIQLGGFGNGEFEMTTNDTSNVFLKDGKLVIKPTLQDTSIIDTPYALVNLTADGTCTSETWSDCWASTNSTNYTIINPIRSGRINTKASASIRYGRVEVRAKMPRGDWLWPAIWLLPVNEVYGPWPASGEIDIVESRGNDHTYKYGGNDKVVSSLHWGPTKALDQSWRDTNTQRSLHSTYSAGFHTYALEWSQKYLYTYVDSRIRHVVYTKYTEPQWTRGQFPQVSEGELISDPWTTNRFNTPFDTPFYLIINLAVGGTNGFFQDPDIQKPWVNTAVNASAYFWAAKNLWLPTWVEGQAQLEVESVKMWQECG